MSPGLRVLQVFDSYLPQTQNWVFQLLDCLPDTKVVIAAREFQNPAFLPEKFQRIEFPMRKIEGPPGDLRADAFNFFASSLRRLLYPRYVAEKAGGIDLMHSHFSYVGWQYRRLARRLQVPHVVSFYGFDYERLPHTEPLWQRRYRTLFDEASLFLCEGSHGAEILAKMGCPAGKIQVLRLGVDTGRLPFQKRTRNPGELRLLQVATMMEKKGHVYTLGAFLAALPHCPNLTLTLVGPDPEGIGRNLREMIAGTPAEARVIFVESIDYGKLSDFMHDYHVFIHPSCYAENRDCEGGAPVVLLDAQASGMPVISTTHCDIPDEVLHGRTGLLCPEKDTASLGEAIRRFYEMENAEYQQYAAAARRHVELHYNALRQGMELAGIYRALLHGKAKGAP